MSNSSDMWGYVDGSGLSQGYNLSVWLEGLGLFLSLWVTLSLDLSFLYKKMYLWASLVAVVKNLLANARDTGLILDLGRSHMLQSN